MLRVSCRAFPGSLRREGGGTTPWAGFLVEVPWDFVVRGCASVTLGEEGRGVTYFR